MCGRDLRGERDTHRERGRETDCNLKRRLSIKPLLLADALFNGLLHLPVEEQKPDKR